MVYKDIIIRLKAETNKAAAQVAKETKAIQQKVKDGVRLNVRSYNQLSKAQLASERAQNKLNKALGRTPFAGYAMSIMFAGMALMRYMQLIWKNSTKTFQDVMHSVEGTTTSFDMLNGQLKYMQFVSGEALAPLAEQLIPIVAYMAQWIQDNEELFRGFVKWGFIIGTVFFGLGQIILAGNGISDAFMLIKGTKFGGFLSEVSSELFGVRKSFSLLRTLMAAGLIAVVAIDIFGSSDKPTTMDWIKNLGMSALAGWQLGGPWGAGIGLVLTAFIMLSKESAREALKQTAKFIEIQNKILRGESVNIDEAIRVNFQGTAIPKAAIEYRNLQQQEMISGITGVNETKSLIDLFKEGFKPEITVNMSVDGEAIAQPVLNSTITNLWGHTQTVN